MKRLVLKYFFIYAVLTVSGAFSFNSFANECNFQLKHSIIISPEHIRILDDGKTIMQFNGKSQLFIQGREITLSEQQRRLITEYVQTIRQQIPEIIDMTIEGFDVGLETISQTITNVTGENSSAHQKLQKRFEEIQWQVRAKLNHMDENYYIAPQNLNDLGNFISELLEKEVEVIVNESLGSLFIPNSNSRTNPPSSNSKFQTLIEKVKFALKSKTTRFESKSVCLSLEKLNFIERKTTNQIEELSDFELFKIY